MIRNIFRGVGTAIHDTVARLAPSFVGKAPEAARVSRREVNYDLACVMVKQRLGHSFFTKRLPNKVRRQRVNSLGKMGRAIARERGWI